MMMLPELHSIRFFFKKVADLKLTKWLDKKIDHNILSQ